MAGVLRIANGLSAGAVTGPVTVPPATDRPLVRVEVRWDDGTSGTHYATAIGWTSTAVQVALTPGDGLQRIPWLPASAVHRHDP